MRRFDWREMRRYWETHSGRWSDLDFDADPHGLTNVCHPGAPLWLNRYYARFQRSVYEQLLASVPPPSAGARALDIGCGAGRWARRLADGGYDTTGIDLQPELLERNRERMPDVTFVRAAAQEFDAPPFELVSSVTVIQHVPFEEQREVVERLRALTVQGGHAVVLENVRDQDPHVFANSIDGWIRLFEANRFELTALRRYDYSPFLRLAGRARRALRGAAGRHDVDDPDVTPERLVSATARGDTLSAVSDAVKRVAVTLDSLIEPVLVGWNLPLPTVHCGFLFQAR